jgi:hypothetical protein
MGMRLIYVKIYRNRFTWRSVEPPLKESTVTPTRSFSTDGVLIADPKALGEAIKGELDAVRTWRQIYNPVIVFQPIEAPASPPPSDDKQAMLDLTNSAGASRMFFIRFDRNLTDDEVREVARAR